MFRMHKKTNIILTGMPGSGKSTVGVILAKELCMDFVDTDILIQSQERTTLQNIIDMRGLDAFLSLEEHCVTGLDVTETVIAPGGSVILNGKVMTFLKQSGIVVFLYVPVDIIKPRIVLYTRGTVRQPGETLDDVWRQREPLYRFYADLIVECGMMNQMEIARFVVEHVNI